MRRDKGGKGEKRPWWQSKYNIASQTLELYICNGRNVQSRNKNNGVHRSKINSLNTVGKELVVWPKL